MEDVVQEALRKGVELHKAGQFDLAKELYASVIRLVPRHADAHHNTGVIEMDTGRVRRALPHLRIALEEDPGNAQYWISYIDALIRHGTIDEARNTLVLAKQKGAEGEAFDQLEQKINKLDGTFLEAKSDDCGELLTKTNILDTLKLDKALKLAKQKSKEGSSEEAQQIYKDILDRFPKNKKAINGIRALAGVTTSNLQSLSKKAVNQLLNFYNEGHLQRTVDEALIFSKQYPKEFEIWNVLGSAAAKISRIDIAEKAFGEVIKLNPKYANGHNNFGNVLKMQGRLNEALRSYQTATALELNHFDAHYNMGDVLRDQGKLKEAITFYKQAINIKSDYSKAYNNMGTALNDIGDLEEAVEAFNKAILIEPHSAEFYSNKGNTLKNLGKLEEAIELHKKALLLNSENPELHFNLCNSLSERGDLNTSIESYKKAIQLKPNYAEAYCNLGLVLKHTGDLDNAIENYKKALKAKPNYYEVYSNIGIAFKDKGELVAAINAYKKAIDIKPESSEVWNNIFYPIQAIKMQVSSISELAKYYPNDTGSQFFQIAQAVLEFRLQRGAITGQICLDETLNTLRKVKKLTIENPLIRHVSEPSKRVQYPKIIALVHFGRSGTGLLHSLIDGHPEVSTLPSIYFSEYFDLSTWEKIISGGWNEIVDRFIAIYPVLFDASSTVPIATKSCKSISALGEKEGLTGLGDQRDEVLKIDKALFRSELNSIIDRCDQLDSFEFFKLLHKAYDKVINDKNQKSLIFYHIHNPDTLAHLNFVKLAPKSKCIMMVREPIQSCESWVRQYFKNNDYTGMVNNIYTMLFEIDNIIYHKQDAIGVRLEDLKEYPRKTVSAVCDWMGIDENESLYEMTAQGKKWWGDPSSPDFEIDGMDPFGKASIKRKIGSIFSDKDQFILHTLFYPFSVRFEYLSENEVQFKENLQVIRPMLDKIFDFEKKLAKQMDLDFERFTVSGPFLFLRAGLIERWETLNTFHTYPNMIEPLVIDQGS